MEDKTRKLVLILEGIAIITATVLILVDYKLKNDLMDLYVKMERALKNGETIYSAGIDPGLLRPGNMVRDAATVETRAANGTIHADSKPGPRGKRPSPERNRGNGNTTIPKPDNPVGP